MALAQALLQRSVVGGVDHCLASIEVNFYAAVLLSAASRSVASNGIRTSLAFNLLELAAGNTTIGEIVNNALCAIVAQRDVNTIVTRIVGVSIDVHVAVPILFKHLRELSQLVFRRLVKRCLIGSKKNPTKDNAEAAYQISLSDGGKKIRIFFYIIF